LVCGVALGSQSQDLGGDPLLQFGHCPDLMAAEVAANEGVILGTSAKVEAVLAAYGAV
jgi:hypothetical protein